MRWESGDFRPLANQSRNYHGRSFHGQQATERRLIESFETLNDSSSIRQLAVCVLLQGIEERDLLWVADDSPWDEGMSFRFWCYAAGYQTEQAIRHARLGIFKEWLETGMEPRQELGKRPIPIISPEICQQLIAALLSASPPSGIPAAPSEDAPPTDLPVASHSHQSSQDESQ